VQRRLGLPDHLVPVFWGFVFLEATFGTYFAIWPLWIEKLGASVAVVGFVLGSAGIIRLFILGPSAAIADRFGYRRTIILARVAAIIGLISAALATHWTQLAIMVAGAALGELVFPLVQSAVAAEAGDQRVRSFALIFNVGPSVALIVSPLLSAGLVALFGMRAAFLFGAVCSTISLYFLSQMREPHPSTQESDEHPATYRAAIASPVIRTIALLLFVTIASLALGVSFIPTFLEDVRGFEPATIAMLGAFPAVGSATFGLLIARNQRLQHAPFVGAAVAVGLTAIALAVIRSSAILPIIAIAFIFRGGLFSTWSMLSAAHGELAPPSLRSRGFALCEMAGGTGFAVGPVIAGFLYAQRPTLQFEVAIGLALVLMPVMLLVQRKANAWRPAISPSPVRDERVDDVIAQPAASGQQTA
jgi:MFS family permease